MDPTARPADVRHVDHALLATDVRRDVAQRIRAFADEERETCARIWTHVREILRRVTCACSDMSELTVSVVLTTYQRPVLARRAASSVLAQTCAPCELIVVEDGAGSGIDAWLRSLDQAELHYVRHEKNLGLAAARNTGLDLARGDYVAYIDDDDEWLPRRLEAQVERLATLTEEQRLCTAAVQVGCRVVDLDGREVGRNLPINQGILRDSIASVGAATPSSSFLFLRTALLDVGGFDDTLISGIDHDIWMKLAIAGYSTEKVDEALVTVYRGDWPTMMSSTLRRVAGVRQYVEKWTPTYREWFGNESGERYARLYFIKVIGKLAGERFARGALREGFWALWQVFTCAAPNPRLLARAALVVARTFVHRAMPFLRSVKQGMT